jgi:hypothetical protein
MNNSLCFFRNEPVMGGCALTGEIKHLKYNSTSQLQDGCMWKATG